MKFKTLLLNFLFLMAMFWPQGGYTSIDFETDLEEGIESTLKSFADVSYEPSDFESFTGRGHMNPDGFAEMHVIFMSLAEPRCDAVKALKAMREAFSSNKPDGAIYQGFNLTKIERGEGVVDFNDQLSFETLRMKLKGCSDHHMILRKQLESAREQHIILKTASLNRQYKTALKTLASAQKGYELIPASYPDRPAEPVTFEVGGMDLSTLKDNVPNFLESVKSYKSGLIPARAWQGKHARLHKTYIAYCAEGEKINAALTELREIKADNPHLGDALEDLPDKSAFQTEGDLEVLATLVAETSKTLQSWRVQLAQAKAWKPPVVEVVEEKMPEAAVAVEAVAVEPAVEEDLEGAPAPVTEPVTDSEQPDTAALETVLETPVLDAETSEESAESTATTETSPEAEVAAAAAAQEVKENAS